MARLISSVDSKLQRCSSNTKLLDRTTARVAAAARIANHHMFDALEPRQLLSATPFYLRYQHDGSSPAASSGAAEVSPAQMRQAYNVNQISINGVIGTGAGQTIALVDAFRDPTLAADLATFDSTLGVAAPPSLTIIRQDGSLVTTSNEPPVDNVDPVGNSWAIETSLDTEWAHVIAPQANILVVLADDSGNGLYTAVSTAAHYAGVSAVSMSWGGSDLGGTDDSLFNVPGVTFVSSSGDSGAYTSRSGASYPAASPNVLAAGGTTLFLDSNGNYSSESAWSGSGGGLSTVEAEPAYQKNVVPTSITTTQRAVPDVSMDADPNSGVAVIDSYDFGSTSPEQYGGTSLASPMWAALIAITNQERLAAGEQTLNQNLTGSTATLPLIYALPSTDFHDVTTGSNGHSALVGYDLATGRGSPIANKLVADLVGAPASPDPVINSLAANPSSVTVGTSSSLTANVTDAGSTISTVAFYKESNSTAGLQTTGDTFLGDGTQNGSNWSINISTTGLATGTYTYYAYATDAANVTTPTGTSAVSTALTVTPVPPPQPVIGSVTVNPTTVTIGTSATVTANNVTDAGSTISSVAIYRESNNTAGLQTSGDTLIGNATKSGSNWSISVSTTGLAAGTYTYYALATDAANVTSPTGTSAPSAALNVTAAAPNLFTTDANIGSPSPTGTSNFISTTGTYTVTGGGSDIYDKSDQFNYDYTSYTGNGSIVAHIATQTNTNSSAKAGIMFRNSTAANSMFVDVVDTPGSGLEFEFRTSTGGNTSKITVGGVKAPLWVKLTRTGNNFVAYYATTTGAPTSTNWKEIGSVSASLSTNALVGLAVCSHNNGTLGTATFNNVQLGLSTLAVPASQSTDPRGIAWNISPNSGGASSNSNAQDYPSPAVISTSSSPIAPAPQDFIGWSPDVQSDDSGTLDAAIVNCFSNLIAIDG